MWVRLVREFSVMIDCRADSDDEVAAQTQKARRARVLARHEPAHRLAPALSHRGGELRGAVPGRRVSR